MLITCATIAQSFMLIVTMPLGGISAGTQSILGYNYGAGNMDRVKSAQKYIILLCVLYTSLMFLMARLLGESFVSLFTRDAGVAENAFRAIRICTLSIVPLGVQYAIVDGFTGMGKVQISLPLSFFRKGVYFAALFLASALWGAGAAFYAETVSDLIPPVVSAVVYFVVMKKM